MLLENAASNTRLIEAPQMAVLTIYKQNYLAIKLMQKFFLGGIASA